jgi:hypothetical protein
MELPIRATPLLGPPPSKSKTTLIKVKTKANETKATVHNVSEELVFTLRRLAAFEKIKDCLPLRDGKWADHIGTADCYLQLVRAVRAETNTLKTLARIEWDTVVSEILPPIHYFIRNKQDPFVTAQKFHSQTISLLKEAMQKIPSQPNYFDTIQ